MSNYFEDGLRVWQANIDIQPMFSEYKTAVYMCSYSTKSEDQSSVAMMQTGKEAFANNCDYFETRETVVKACTYKREYQFSSQSYIN